jgi:uncharacterized protein YbjQ (UPF0145 family)
MLNEIDVELSSEYIKRNIKDSPKEAIKELIWNACDADATSIEISFNTTGLNENMQNIETYGTPGLTMFNA